jgi:hypothetical protein
MGEGRGEGEQGEGEKKGERTWILTLQVKKRYIILLSSKGGISHGSEGRD